MSMNQPASSAVSKATTDQQARVQQDSLAPGQDPLDKRLKRLKDDVLPFYPLLLTVPTEVPFHLGGRFVNNWAVGKDGPFAPEEQQLQYMTFLTHQQGDSLLVAVGDWSDGSGGIMTAQRSTPQSPLTTPIAAATKKNKISLKDYKIKKCSESLAASPAENSARPAELSSQAHEVTDPPPKPHDARTENLAHNFASKLDDASAEFRPNLKRTPDKAHDNPSDLKKRPRTSAEKAKALDEQRAMKQSNGLPVLLSPTLPPTSDSPKLPRLLSPTLPPDLEAELARYSKDSQGQPQETKDLGNVMTNLPASLSDDSPKIRPSSRTIAGHSANVELSKAEGKPQSESRSHTNTTEREKSTPRPARSSSLAHEPRMLVKLRYGRANRKRVEALLKFSGKARAASNKVALLDNGEPERGQQPKHENQAYLKDSETSQSLIRMTLPTSGSSLEPLQDGDKGKKQLAYDRQRSSTSHQSPPYAVQHAQQIVKSKLVTETPGKDSTSGTETRRRARSGDSDIGTPVPPTSKHSSKESERSSKLSPTQIERGGREEDNSRARNEERRAWKMEFQRLVTLGRELKHAADRQLTKENVIASDEQLAAVTAIEAVLCFILAFMADDKYKSMTHQVADSSAWLSILAYWRVVKNSCLRYPHLHTLCLLLGAVSYDAIHALDLERLAVTTIPGDHTSVPTPGSDGNTVTSDESRRARKEFADLKQRLPEYHKEAQNLWLEGSRGLSPDTLSRDFPITWAGRSKTYSQMGCQVARARKYSGNYFLPLGKSASAIEVVRFVWAVLSEWCEREKVPWSGRIGL